MNSRQDQAWQAIVDEIRNRMTGVRGEQTVLARRLGVDKSTIARWVGGELKGKRVPYDAMLRYMEALDLAPSDYFDQDEAVPALVRLKGPEGELPGADRAGPEDFHPVPWVNAEASMGGGSLVADKTLKAHIAFRTEWLRSKGPLGAMVAVNARGDSMEPTISDGSVVLIDESQKYHPSNNKIYLVSTAEGLLLKRLRVDENGVPTALISDRGRRETPVEHEEHFAIIGRAVWVGKDL